MEELIVCTCCNKPNGLMPMYIQQLGAAGIPYHNEVTKTSNIMDLTIGVKMETLKYFAHKYSNFKRIVLTDAWDFLFYGTLEEVVSKIPEGEVILAAERNCFPYEEPRTIISGITPWKFANGGFTAGSPQAILGFCNRVEQHPYYDPKTVDQGWYNARLAEKDELINIDLSTKLVYCMYQETDDLTGLQGRPYNGLCGTIPNFIHFNGRWPTEKFGVIIQESLRRDANEKSTMDTECR